MKILFFSRLYYPHIGGVEKHVEEISRVLVKIGHDVTVLTEKFDKSLRGSEIINGVKIIRIDNGKNDWFKKFRVWINIWKNRKLILNADVIHVHDVFFWILPFRFLFLTKKIFVTFHGYEGKFPVSNKSIVWRKLGVKISNGSIAVGKYIEKWYGIKCNNIVYGGVNVPVLKLDKGRHSGDKKIRITFLGRLEKDTGLICYLKALESLRKKGKNFVFKAVGDGSLRNRVEELGRVTGFILDSKKYIKNSDIVFASSYLSIIEALALGKKVISVYDSPLKKDYLVMSPLAKFIQMEESAEGVANAVMNISRKSLANSDSLRRWLRGIIWEKIADKYINLWEK